MEKGRFNKTYRVEEILECMNLGIDYDVMETAEEAIQYTQEKYPEIEITEGQKHLIEKVYNKNSNVSR